MGSALCKEDKLDDEAYVKHKKIEQSLKENRELSKKIIKILLLGSADSGKSTIAKQMRYTQTSYPYISILLPASISFKYQFRIIVNQFYASYNVLLDMDDEEQINKLAEIRACSCITEACKRINEFYVPDNTNYLFSEANRILQLKYTPTQIDVIHARALTTGVHEITFTFRKFSIRLIDVGGQKTERRKWIHCFEGVTATLFVTSLSCYDQFLEDNPYKNRMEDSIELFHQMYRNQFLVRSSFILFFNKKDLFEEKIKNNPISNYLPNLQCPSEYEQVFKVIANLFLKVQNEHEGNTRYIYSHATNATDTKNIDFVFGAACEIILQNNLSRAGMT